MTHRYERSRTPRAAKPATSLPAPQEQTADQELIQRFMEDPAALSTDDVQTLQEKHGNTVVSSLLEQTRTQPPGGQAAPLMHRGVPAGPPTQVQRADEPEPDPAKDEWDAHPSIHGHFSGGLATYRTLRPLYQGRGITNPAEYLDNNIVTVTFFGHSTPAHTDMSTPLATAEQNLRGQNVTPTINSFWAFVPRTIRNGSALSNHALGRAVDINPANNPMISNAQDYLVIQAVTGIDLSQTQTEANLRQASQTFQSTFNQAWVDQQTQLLQTLQQQLQQGPAPGAGGQGPAPGAGGQGPAPGAGGQGPAPGAGGQQPAPGAGGQGPAPGAGGQQPAPGAGGQQPAGPTLQQQIATQQRLVNAINARRTQLNEYALEGFLNLEQTLIDALQDAGFTWGGEWEDPRDFMHFEI